LTSSPLLPGITLIPNTLESIIERFLITEASLLKFIVTSPFGDIDVIYAYNGIGLAVVDVDVFIFFY
jgi:hypothetical protein